jgi:GR25 family glycosyltransferase involved in LPS biosynthesis
MTQFKRLQRFSAVDGSKLDVEHDTRISLHTRHNIKNKYRRSHYEINTPGAIGASFSHITLWQNFLKTKDEYLVVFEDDTVVTEQELQAINALIPSLPAQWDLWLLGRHKWSFKETPINGTDWVTVTEFTGAHVGRPNPPRCPPAILSTSGKDGATALFSSSTTGSAGSATASTGSGTASTCSTGSAGETCSTTCSAVLETCSVTEDTASSTFFIIPVEPVVPLK